MSAAGRTEPPAPAPPRVLLVMPDQWPRALLRAALRESGYDAVGTRSLDSAQRIQAVEPGRAPVRLVVVDQNALAGDDDERVTRLLARHHDAPAMLLAHATSAQPAGPWQRVVRRPLSVGDVATAARALLPLDAGQRPPD